FFFFSSRRRHTRFSRDWSSDVCSSDLPNPGLRKSLLTSLNYMPKDGQKEVLLVPQTVICRLNWKARFFMKIRPTSTKRPTTSKPIWKTNDRWTDWFVAMSGSEKRKLPFVLHSRWWTTASKWLCWFRLQFWRFSITRLSGKD